MGHFGGVARFVGSAYDYFYSDHFQIINSVFDNFCLAAPVLRIRMTFSGSGSDPSVFLDPDPVPDPDPGLSK